MLCFEQVVFLLALLASAGPALTGSPAALGWRGSQHKLCLLLYLGNAAENKIPRHRIGPSIATTLQSTIAPSQAQICWPVPAHLRVQTQRTISYRDCVLGFPAGWSSRPVTHCTTP
jgi:hypothetical protein